VNSSPGGGTSNSKPLTITDTVKSYAAGPIFPSGDVPSVVANNVMVVADGPSANVFLFNPTNSIWSEATQLGDWVSVAVGPNGSPAVTGAPATSPTGSGTASVFRAGIGWPTGPLSGSPLFLPTAAGPLFGKSVAINVGNAVFVGDPGNASVFVFTPINRVQWNLASQLTDSASGTSSGFGSSVSVSLIDSVVAVGEPQGPTAPGQVGIYFGFLTSTNMPNAVLQASGAANGDMEGFSVQVSADGNTVIFGGPGANSGTGAAWVFTKSNNDTWSQTATLLAKTAHAGDGFGTSVAASSDGSTLVVGAPGVNSGAGAVYVFQGPFAGTQNESQLLMPYAGTAIDGSSAVFTTNFGTYVNISSDASTISVGGSGTDSSGTKQPMAGLLQ
jgi:FG-GAP repeat protein